MRVLGAIWSYFSTCALIWTLASSSPHYPRTTFPESPNMRSLNNLHNTTDLVMAPTHSATLHALLSPDTLCKGFVFPTAPALLFHQTYEVGHPTIHRIWLSVALAQPTPFLASSVLPASPAVFYILVRSPIPSTLFPSALLAFLIPYFNLFDWA